VTGQLTLLVAHGDDDLHPEHPGERAVSLMSLSMEPAISAACAVLEERLASAPALRQLSAP
jgi:hypothetical protein